MGGGRTRSIQVQAKQRQLQVCLPLRKTKGILKRTVRMSTRQAHSGTALHSAHTAARKCQTFVAT